MSASDRYIRHVSVLIKLLLSVIFEITLPLHSGYTTTLIQCPYDLSVIIGTMSCFDANS